MNEMLSWRAKALDSDNLSKNARYLLLYLSTHMNDWGESAFPGIATIAGRTLMSRRTVYAALAELVEAKWLIKQNRYRPDGGQTTNNYLASHPSHGSLKQNGVQSSHGEGAVLAPPPCSGRTHNSSVNSSHKPIERGRFAPPSVLEVLDYVAPLMLNIDPEAFVDHYESKGWMVGKNKMKDWKAAARGWARREAQYARKHPEQPVKGEPRTPRQWQQWCRKNGHGDGPRGFSEEQFISWATEKYRRQHEEQNA